MRTLLRATPFGFGFLLLSACGAGNAPNSLTATTSVSPSRITHIMPRGGSSTASVHTLPNSTCQLSAANAQTLRVFADDEGVARVHLDHLDTSVSGGELAMVCTDESGASLTHTIDVVIDDNAVGQEPEKYNTAGKPTLPLLDVDPASLAAEDLMARHYPPRPDAVKSPGQYAQWLNLVKSGPAVIEPHVVADPARTHGKYNSTSNNWSGYVLTNPSSTYAWIYGEWSVPRAYAESGFYSSDHSSFWVGLDGWGSPDVVQDGTDSDTVTAFWVQTSSYDAWVEWYPLSSQSISNFPVNPGDDIHAWTWVLDAAGNYDVHGTVGWYYVWNATQGVYCYYSINAPSGTTFKGNTAEWVMERPTVSGSLSSLANYSYAQLTNTLAYDLAGGSHLYGGDSTNNSWNLTMTGSNNATLSTVSPINASTMAFTFHGHN